MDVKSAPSNSDINTVLQQMRQIRKQTQAGENQSPMGMDVAYQAIMNMPV